MTENCENDCAYYCTGCDRFFHEIKDEHELDHSLEMPEYECTLAGNYYCHPDCGVK